MRLLILGGAGVTGLRTVKIANERGHEVIATFRNTLPPPDYKKLASWVKADVDELDTIRRLLDTYKPEAVIDMHAYNRVDDCEDVGRDECWKSNAMSPKLWAMETRKREIKYLYVSTDFVFDGENPPYDESSTPHPLSQYAISKLVGEQSALSSDAIVLRTAVVYDADPRSKFLGWVMRNLREGKKIGGFIDQWNNPTLARDLALASVLAIERLEGPELLHAVGRECVSRYRFAVEIARTFNLDESLIEPTCSCRVRQKARRPFKACLKTDKIEEKLNFVPRGPKEALTEIKDELERVFG